MEYPEFPSCENQKEYPSGEKLPWISVSDYLPEIGERVLTAYGFDAQCVEINRLSHVETGHNSSRDAMLGVRKFRKVFWENSPPKGDWTPGNPDVFYWLRISTDSIAKKK